MFAIPSVCCQMRRHSQMSFPPKKNQTKILKKFESAERLDKAWTRNLSDWTQGVIRSWLIQEWLTQKGFTKENNITNIYCLI